MAGLIGQPLFGFFPQRTSLRLTFLAETEIAEVNTEARRVRAFF